MVDTSQEQTNGAPERRQRGKRRHGRQNTSEKHPSSSTKKETLIVVPELETIGKEKRYCKGRKPVTDFPVGSVHSGKVVYVKPFGVFFDIGCHSDGFCHVSRLADDYVENPQEKFREGQQVQSIRVVEVDRKKKRLTVSLQSESMKDQEMKSIEARQGRKRTRQEKDVRRKAKAYKPASAEESKDSTNRETKESEKDKNPVQPQRLFNTTENQQKERSEGQELKRQRKLARRAARRAQAEEATD